MARRIILAVLLAIIVTLACLLLGAILITLKVEIAVTVGKFLKDWSAAIGVLAGLWSFFAGWDWPARRV
jgi:hypothetical protein